MAYHQGMTVNLDEAQARAVAHGAGPCLVLAGPGSGKTRVIVERFLRLIHEGVPPERILVLTYTRKAAAEMRERVEALHGGFTGDPPLLNYHSFAQRVLRQWAWKLGVSPAFRIADEAERWLVVDAILGELKPTTLYNPLRPHDLVDAVLTLIGQAKQELVSPADYAQWAGAQLEACTNPVRHSLLLRHQDCAAVYRQLEERCKQRAILDHDDTILYAQRLLADAGDVHDAITSAIDYVMVDEYQDTNYAQARLVECLVHDHGNLLVVADDDQSIYKFRGASLANLDRFARIYPEHERIVLNRNYRSTTSIVAASRAMIEAAKPESRIDKTLIAVRGDGNRVELWRADDERGEVVSVAEECSRLIQSGTPAGDIAWLFRRHDDMQAATRGLRECGVPYIIHGGRGFFQQREIKDLLALLGGVLDPGNSQAVLRCLNLPAYAVSNPGRLALTRAAHEHDLPLATVITTGLPGLDQPDQSAARRCIDNLIELHGQSTREDVRDLFYAVLEASEFLGLLDGAAPAARDQMGANLNRFGELLEGFADWSDDRSLGLALRYLEVLRNSRAADEVATIESTGTGVSLLTAHSAKGLEWPIVILARCSDHRWPGMPGLGARLSLPDELVPEPAPRGEGSLDEERRLFYVAATRARDRLILVHARRYPHSFRDERRSQFLDVLDSMEEAVERREIAGTRPPQPLRPAELLGVPPQRIRASVSDLATYKECPRRYAYRAVYHVPAPESAQRWYGILIHTVLQAMVVQRQSGVAVTPDNAAQLWNEAWRAARGPKGAHPELRPLGEEQLRRYVGSAGWQSPRVVAVEEPFVLDVDAADVTGRFDRVDESLAGRVVVDYKTGPPRAEEEMQRDLQVRAYATALSRQQRSDDVAVELHWLQTAEVTRVRFDRRSLGTSYGHVEGAARELASARQLMDFPAKPSAWRCRRCDYRTICDEGRAAQ